MLYALIGALLIGVSLGLLGSGGAILTVPILVYLLGHPEKQAITESLAIVGAIALAGALRNATQGRVDPRRASLFGVPGMAGAYLGAWGARWVPGAVQLMVLAGIMLAAAALMARQPPEKPTANGRDHWASMIAQGLAVGVVTGLVGVGGGFLIVPALVLLSRLEMPRAVGTSLAIIFLNCVAGFVKSLGVLGDLGGRMDWATVGVFSGVGIAGLLAGNVLAGALHARVLRRIFAGFLIVMAGYILWREGVARTGAAGGSSRSATEVAGSAHPVL